MTGLVVDVDGDIFVLHGEFDMAETAAFEGSIADRIEANPPAGDVTLDLADVSFVDSSAIRCLLRLAKELSPRKLNLRAPQPTVSKVFELTSIADYPNIELV